jgi:uncharacterized protein YggE
LSTNIINKISKDILIFEKEENNMKYKKGILSVVLTVIMVLSIFALNQLNVPASAENQVMPISAPAEYFGEKTITTNGSASISVAPDVAYVNVGVIAEHKNLETAQAQANKQMKGVMESLTKLGIDEKDIKTTNFYVNPKYDWSRDTGVSNIVGYTVNNTVEITVNDLDKLGTIIDSVTANGSNQVSNIRFGLKDDSEIYNKALEVAVKNAKSKAEAIAKGLDAKDVIPVKVTESGYSSPVMYDKGMVVRDMVAESTAISTGELQVTASVSIEFSFK